MGALKRIRGEKLRDGWSRYALRISGCLVLIFALGGMRDDRATAQAPSHAVTSSSIGTPRQTASGQSATLLPDGRWLLVGGTTQGEAQSTIYISTGTTVQPFPANLDVARSGQTATVLPNGTVLVAGGTGTDGQLVAGAEVIDPVAGTVQPLAVPNVALRTEGTATLLMDGQVLFVGGLDDSGQPLAAAQLWDAQTDSVGPATPALLYARYDQTAALLSDGTVAITGGRGAVQGQALPAEQFNPSTQLFEPVTAFLQNLGPASTGIAASIPDNDASDVAVDAQIAVRLATPINPAQLNASTVTLVGPSGAVSGKVVGAEGGRLAFFTPTIDLLPNTTYTLFVSGVSDASGAPVPLSTVRFTTHQYAVSSDKAPSATPATRSATAPSAATKKPARPAARSVLRPKFQGALQLARMPVAGATQPRPPQQANTQEDWVPQGANRHGQWRVLGLSGDPPLDPAASSITDLSAADGTTAIAGHVLRLNGKPLAGVRVSAGRQSTTTDSTGRFLLSGLGAGTALIEVDGTGVVSNGRHYTEHYIRVDVTAGKTATLPGPVFLPRVDPATEVTIASPADQEIVLTHPGMPGLEVHIPRGTVIRTFDGKIVTKVSITPIPVDRPPYATPVPFSTYFTLQPAGAYVEAGTSKGIRVIYPNYQGLPPGASADFWNYDPASGGWTVYGHGKVSADGKQVVPDESVAFHQIMSFGLGIGNNPEPTAGPTPNGCTAADPVDCASGLFSHTLTDLSVNDVIPITATRLYRTNDNVSREFGVGGNLSYAMWLSSTNTSTGVTLIRGDGSRISFTPTGSNTYQSTTSPTEFLGSTLALNTTTDLWHLTLRDGTVYTFYNAYYPNQLVSITDRNGNTVTITVQTSSACATTNPLPITQVTSPNGRYIQFTYDASCRITKAVDNSGRSVSYVYDSANHLQKATDADGNSEVYGYDATTNNMNSITDKRGNTEAKNVYDTNGRVTQQTLADGAIWKFSYTLNASGGVTQTTITDPRNYVRQMAFNASGYPTQIILAQGKPEQQTYTVTLGSNNMVSTVTDTLNRKTQYNYDSYGDVTSIVLLAGTSSAVSYGFQYDPTYHQLTSYTDPLLHTTSIGLDIYGNVASVTDPLGHSTTIDNDSQGLPAQITDALGHATKIGYTGADLASVTNGLGNTTSIFTDNLGRIAVVTDPLGNRRQFTYDPMDRITSALDPLGENTQLSYDQNGNVLKVVDPRSNAIHVLTYDVRNRVHTDTNPDGNVTTYTWDGMGNLVSLLDGKGQLTTYTYDGIDRPTKITFATGTTIQITWDGGSRATAFVDSVSGTIQRTFDGLDRLTQETSPQGQVGYQYDAASRRTQMTVSGQSLPVLYGYDADNRLTSVAQGSVEATVGYDVVGRRTSITLPNGIVETLAFDNANELTSISDASGATAIGGLVYTYDTAGRITAQSGTFATLVAPTAVTSATYDAADRLTNWNGTAVGYDADGNVVSVGSTTLTWNARNQLASTTAGSSTFSYDPVGRRVSRTVGGVSTDYLWDERNPVSVSGSLMLAGLGLDEYYARIASGVTTSFLRDGLGSTRALTNASDATTVSYSYGPYGNGVPSGSDSTPFQFTGRDNDGASGLYYYRSRYYNPAFGRFVSTDSVGLLGGINPYAYANGDPMDDDDPLGFAAHLVLLEYGNPTDQALYDWAASYQPTNYNTVVVHGTNTGQFAEEPIAYSVVPPQSIAKLLEESKGYDPTLPTQLVACSAGATRTGAQALANALGTTVFAATQVLIAGPTPGSPPQVYVPENFWGWLSSLLFGPSPPPPVNWVAFHPAPAL